MFFTYFSGVEMPTANYSFHGIAICLQPMVELSRPPFARMDRTRCSSTFRHFSNEPYFTAGPPSVIARAYCRALPPTESRWQCVSCSTWVQFTIRSELRRPRGGHRSYVLCLEIHEKAGGTSSSWSHCFATPQVPHDTKR